MCGPHQIFMSKIEVVATSTTHYCDSAFETSLVLLDGRDPMVRNWLVCLLTQAKFPSDLSHPWQYVPGHVLEELT